jgi:uncharacterized protein (DUF58 family)
VTARRRLTASGKACLLAALVALAAAVVFGHPFPALVGGFALGLLLLSLPGAGALGRLQFLGLRPVWLLEDEQRLLELDYRLGGVTAPLHVSLHSRGPIFELRGATPALLPTPLGRLPVRVRALRRGRYERLAFELAVRGPFGFAPAGAVFEAPTEAWVLPRPRALRERVLEEMLSLRPRGLDRPQPTGPGEGEFYALKEWRPGEPERRVHARLSARRGRKVVRVFRGEAPPLVHLLVDPRVGQHGRTFGSGDFDEALRFAAGIVKTLLQRGVPVSLALVETHESRPTARVACAPSCRDLHSFLGALALARPLPSGEPPGLPPLPQELAEGRRVLIHLGQVDEARLPREWLAIRAGSRRYYQLLDTAEVAGAPAS